MDIPQPQQLDFIAVMCDAVDARKK